MSRHEATVSPTADAAQRDAMERDVLRAADAIVDDFGNHRRDAYFTGFAVDATFLFHSTPERLESRESYETLWDEWETIGFRVHRCVSTNQRVQLLGSAAVFSHDVETTAEIEGETATTFERETIVFEFRDGRWLAMHEHLSARTE